MKLSAVVIAQNEEAVIERCVASLRFADEVVVVDGGSTDDTVARARRSGARVIGNPWRGYGNQKNFGLTQVRGEWVLFVDADEVIAPQLAQEIVAAIQESKFDFFWVRITTYFLGQPLRHLFGHNLRLFKRARGRWSESFVHEQVIDSLGQTLVLRDTRAQILPTPLLHWSHDTVGSYLDTMHRYTTLEAQEMHRTAIHRSGRKLRSGIFLPAMLAGRQFVKLLFYRRGFLDGYPGVVWCVLSAYYEWEAATKLLAIRQGKNYS